MISQEQTEEGEEEETEEGQTEEGEKQEEEGEKGEGGGWEEGEGGGWEEGEGVPKGEGEEEEEKEEEEAMFVPTKGVFFQHDTRYATGEEDDQEKKSVRTITNVSSYAVRKQFHIFNGIMSVPLGELTGNLYVT